MSGDHGETDHTETVNISAFRATCLARLDRVKRTGRPPLITRKGEPVAQVNPPPPTQPKASWLGTMQTTGRIVADIVSPATSDRRLISSRQVPTLANK